MSVYRRGLAGLALALSVSVGGGAANANIVVLAESITPTVGGFSWNYDVDIDAIQQANTGAFFTLYDFSPNNVLGLILSENLTAAGWVASSNLVGQTPGTVNPTDNPGLWNLTWTYTGAVPLGPNADLGDFSLFATTDATRTVNFTGQATRITGVGSPATQANIGTTVAPVPGPAIGAGIPGLIAAFGGFVAWKRRRKAAVA